jgi:NAD(P)-dependent dehydrogenase (short-subunit alcohol dehydrogenase family)
VSDQDQSEVPAYESMLRLDGKRFIVLGGGQGIGRQTAHALHRTGARVACIDKVASRADFVAAEIGGLAMYNDITQPGSIEEIVERTESEFGGVDGVVDVVGMSRFQEMVTLSDDDWQWQFDIVARHVWHTIKYATPALVRQGGGPMVFVASVSAITGAPQHALYGAAKAALMSLVRSSAVELAPEQIRVNAIAPGIAWTPRVEAMIGEAGRIRNAANSPLGRVGLSSDMASAILFLASPLAAYVTGQTLVVDGGIGVKFPYPSPDSKD